jgi:hypothetical protein
MGISFNELLKKQKSAVKQPQSIAASHTEHPVASVQRMIGNAATVCLLQREGSDEEPDDANTNANANNNANAPQNDFTIAVRAYQNLKQNLADQNYNDAGQWISVLVRRNLSPALGSLSIAAIIEGMFQNALSKKGSLARYAMAMKVERLRNKIIKLVQDYEAVPGAYQLFSDHNFLPSRQTKNPFEQRRQEKRAEKTHEKSTSHYQNRLEREGD